MTLRVATSEDKPAKAKTITQAAELGTRREMLEAMRLRIARAMDSADCLPRDLAALSRRLDDIDAEIRELDGVNERDGIGDAAATPDEAFPTS